jgi:hypothetical protein
VTMLPRLLCFDCLLAVALIAYWRFIWWFKWWFKWWLLVVTGLRLLRSLCGRLMLPVILCFLFCDYASSAPLLAECCTPLIACWQLL